MVNTEANEGKTKRFYIEQFGYFWSLSRVEFKGFLTDAISNDGCYDLCKFKSLKRKPSSKLDNGSNFISPLKFVGDVEMFQYCYDINFSEKQRT